MDETLTERERRILADIEHHLAVDQGLERRLRAGRLGLRGLWYRAVLVNAVLAATGVAAITLTVAAARTGLPALAQLCAALWAVAAVFLARSLALHLRRTPRGS
jgi:hypothetical protein